MALTGSSEPAFSGPSSWAFGIDAGQRANPTFVNIDDDGDLDLFIGNLQGVTFFFRNIGSRESPLFVGA